jgi:uncharacterized protein (DUF433 family)
MDWTGCDLVERIPGKVSGQPIVRGTRILADGILSNYQSGSPIEEIQENFPSLSRQDIEQLIAFAQTQREVAR